MALVPGELELSSSLLQYQNAPQVYFSPFPSSPPQLFQQNWGCGSSSYYFHPLAALAVSALEAVAWDGFALAVLDAVAAVARNRSALDAVAALDVVAANNAVAWDGSALAALDAIAVDNVVAWNRSALDTVAADDAVE